MLRHWTDISRFFYNKTVEHVNAHDKDTMGTWMSTAAVLMKSHREDYVTDVPYQVRRYSVKECFTAFRTNCRKAKKDGKPFEMHFSSRKEPVQSCFIPKTAVSESGIYYTISGNMKWSEKDFVGKEICDCRLILDNDRWFVCIPVRHGDDGVRDSQAGVVAVDPGIRTFCTYFSTDGRFGQVGHGAFERIARLRWAYDRLKSKRDTEKVVRRKASLKRAMRRILWKIRNLIDELHWKTIDYLTKNYSVIVYPPFNVSKMVKKDGRRIRKSTVNAMMSFRFYEFAQRLSQKCAERGVTLVRQDESYTSRTNGFDGTLMKIGSRESFRFENVTVNRDINGARNILIRALRDTSAAV